MKLNKAYKWKTTSMEATLMEVDLDGRQLQWKITSKEDDINGRQHQLKTSIEDDLKGRKHQWKTTSVVVFHLGRLALRSSFMRSSSVS